MTTDATSASHWLPWASVNLRRNPFGELSREERAELAVVEVDPIVEFISESHCAVQLIGDCGRGKTTRMLALHHRLPDSSYVYLPEDAPCPSIAMGQPLLIDEAQRLPRRVRREVWGTKLPMVLSTHWDLSRSLKRYGYRVMTIRIGIGNTAALVHQLLNRRIESSRLHAGPVPCLSMTSAGQLVSRFGTDVRAIEHYLYEQLQNQVDQYGQVRSIDCVG